MVNTRSFIFLVCLTGLPSLVCSQAELNKKKIVREAGAYYYNLRIEGLASFECSVTPNWELLLGDLKQDPETLDRTKKAFSALRFMVRVAEDGRIKVTHNDPPLPSEIPRDGYEHMVHGIEGMIFGFFEDWKKFVLTLPFPDPEDTGRYQLEQSQQQYRLSYRVANADVVTTMRKDFVTTSMKITSQEGEEMIHPTFKETRHGFLLAGFEATAQSQDHHDAGEARMSVDYQEIDGLEMIQKVTGQGTYNGSPFVTEFTFANCKMTKMAAAP